MAISRGAITSTALIAGLAGASSAHAEIFNVPSGRLEDVLISIGQRGRVTIILSDAGLAAQPSPGAQGRMSPREAVAQALRGTDGTARVYGPAIIRIVKRRQERKAAVPAPPTPSAPPSVQDTTPIIVTASKQNVPLDHYPGSVKMVDLNNDAFAAGGGETMSLTKHLPVLGSTNLGPGRIKFFIRGIADSSFTGQTQATTGQYFGDIRLNYSAPDPDLSLYDMYRAEILVGPQGALYGAGSLGGIVRLVPNAPDLAVSAGSASASIGVTRKGGISHDAAAMLNLPLAQDKIAARFVLYEGRAGGYIDAPAQHRRDINDTTRRGQRFTLRAKAASGWDISVGIVQQKIKTEDGQYTVSGDPPLTRDVPIAQPFRNHYRLSYVMADQNAGAVDLVTVTSLARHRLLALFDATGFDGTRALFIAGESNHITLFSHETRISGGDVRAPWVGGIALLANSSRVALSIGPSGAPLLLGEVANRQAEAALFGKYALELTSSLTGAIGGRLTFARNRQALSINRTDVIDHKSSTDVRWSGTLSIDWHAGDPLSLFFQFQQGYRPGGLGITLTETRLEGRSFAADDLHLYEVGVRLGTGARAPLSARASIFLADWRHIQADLIRDPGLPYTTNIGRGIISGLDVDLTWRPKPALTVSLAAFLNHSKLSHPAAGYMVSDGQNYGLLTRALPNVARNGARVGAAWSQSISDRTRFKGDASLRYVGRSHLGFGPLLDVSQGDYLVADAMASVDLGAISVSAKISNAADARANTFAYGNPYSLARRKQITPLRPRMITLGINAHF